MAFRQAQARIQIDDLGPRVAAENLGRIGRLDRDNFLARAMKNSRHVGQVILVVSILGGKLADVLV